MITVEKRVQIKPVAVTAHCCGYEILSAGLLKSVRQSMVKDCSSPWHTKQECTHCLSKIKSALRTCNICNADAPCNIVGKF